jgi:tRNA(Ile)-lysidine synthase
MAFSPEQFLQDMQTLLDRCVFADNQHRTLILAYSGGLDSHVLLHVLAQHRATLVDWRLRVVHADHGLHSESDNWSQHCVDVCQQYDLGCDVLKLDINVAGESLEASARQARYQALAKLMQQGDVLLTAQHADDQAETFMLQMLRGSGPRGMAAMPTVKPFANGFHVRPLLNYRRHELQHYAEQHGLNFVHDPSNDDRRFDRNFLRHDIMPLLQQRWPALVETLGRDAQQQAEAAELLDVIAAQDFAVCQADIEDCLSVSALAGLDNNRQRNLLRYWLRQQGVMLPQRRKLNEILRVMLEAGEDRQPHVDWQGGEVRRYRDALFASAAGLPAIDWQQHWDLQGPLRLPPGLGSLAIKENGHELDLSRLASAPVRVSFRQGGEQCRPAGRGHRHSLKKLFQEAAVPPWQRERTPLVYVGDELAQIMGVCVCEPFKAQAGKPSVNIVWQQPHASR